MREAIAALVRAIDPLDALEREHIAATLRWIDAGEPLWRTAKPATPPMHLVAYFVVVDPAQSALLLVDHRLAGRWLPSGGHVEPGEHPRQTVVREMREELQAEAQFLLDVPLFVTVTQTVGAAIHSDVSLWYALRGDAHQPYVFDLAEFAQVAWFPLADLPRERVEPHLARFVTKLGTVLPASR